MAHFYNLESLPIEGDSITECKINSYSYTIVFNSGKKIDVFFNNGEGASNFYNYYKTDDSFTIDEYKLIQEDLKTKEDYTGTWNDLSKQKEASYKKYEDITESKK